jgi:hypothetical protein
MGRGRERGMGMGLVRGLCSWVYWLEGFIAVLQRRAREAAIDEGG